MVKNENVVYEFINGNNDKIKTKHLFFENNILYSYGYHYPLCIKLLNGYVVNLNGYSNTTARHKSILCYALNNTNFKVLEKNKPNNIVLLDTEQMKKLIEQIKELNINSIEDLKNFLIINNL